MNFYKRVDIVDATAKYGFKQTALVAREHFKKGERVYQCLDNCDYTAMGDGEIGWTRDEILKMSNDPAHTDFIMRYNYTCGVDLLDLPREHDKQIVNCPCVYFNHSCEPNCAIGPGYGFIVAQRDIQPGDELTYDYGYIETESSFYRGIICKCGSKRCRGKLTFDWYRHIDWQHQNYEYCNWYVKERIDDLKVRWYSMYTYLKHYENDPARPTALVDKRGTVGLTAREELKDNELVAIFADENNIKPTSHYIRHSSEPNCFIGDKNRVYTSYAIQAETELTLNYHSI